MCIDASTWVHMKLHLTLYCLNSFQMVILSQEPQVSNTRR